MLTAAALHQEGLDDATLVTTYQKLFGFDVSAQFPAGPGVVDTEERQLVRRRMWEETRPFFQGARA